MRRLIYCSVLLIALSLSTRAQQDEEEGYHRSLVRGRARLEEGHHTAAIEYFERALELEPGDMEASFSLATAMMGQLRFEEALKILSPILQKRPDNPTILNNMAWCLLNSKDPDVKDVKRALALSRRAVFLLHTNYNLWHTLASIHYELGDYERAKRVVSVAIHTARMRTRSVPRECEQLLARCEKALGEDSGAADKKGSE